MATLIVHFLVSTFSLEEISQKVGQTRVEFFYGVSLKRHGSEPCIEICVAFMQCGLVTFNYYFENENLVNDLLKLFVARVAMSRLFAYQILACFQKYFSKLLKYMQ